MSNLKRRVRLKLHELSEVEVNYVSLVPRGANRLPFKVLKADKSQEKGEMIRFTKKPTQEQDMSKQEIVVKAEEAVVKADVAAPPAEKPADMSDADWKAWQAAYAAQAAAAPAAPVVEKAEAVVEDKKEPVVEAAPAATAPVTAAVEVTLKGADIAAAVLAALQPFKAQLDALTGLSAQVEGVAKTVQTLNDSVTGLQKRVDEVGSKAESVEKAVKATVVSSGAPAGDTPAASKKQTQKGGSVWDGALPGFPT